METATARTFVQTWVVVKQHCAFVNMTCVYWDDQLVCIVWPCRIAADTIETEVTALQRRTTASSKPNIARYTMHRRWCQFGRCKFVTTTFVVGDYYCWLQKCACLDPANKVDSNCEVRWLPDPELQRRWQSRWREQVRSFLVGFASDYTNSKKCEWLDPAGCDGKCKFPNYKGDGNCDDENKWGLCLGVGRSEYCGLFI